jgi:uncharacterized protein (TIGR00730 family)
LRADLNYLLDHLPETRHGELIQLALAVIVRMAGEDIDRLDWKICNGALRDMEQAFTTFYPYRHIRKIAIFGSARIGTETPEYQMAVEFARRVTQAGFMVITGAGGGIMQAGNEGAGREKSFGLNIQLPFEQGANPFIEGDRKLVPFKYFFTRKLFFLRESDALALFPGGFGTQDEAFECITLSQTGKSAPMPLVLMDVPGGNYWHDWNDYIHKQLLRRGLISPEDPSLYTITDDIDVACDAIASFYRVFHSCRYVGNRLVLRLNSELTDAEVAQLNRDYQDILVKGQIEKSLPLPQEAQEVSLGVSRLVLQFNQRDLGRLYQLIAEINRIGIPPEEEVHPERK